MEPPKLGVLLLAIAVFRTSVHGSVYYLDINLHIGFLWWLEMARLPYTLISLSKHDPSVRERCFDHVHERPVVRLGAKSLGEQVRFAITVRVDQKAKQNRKWPSSAAISNSSRRIRSRLDTFLFAIGTIARPLANVLSMHDSRSLFLPRRQFSGTRRIETALHRIPH
jgi:hypothetical protein